MIYPIPNSFRQHTSEQQLRVIFFEDTCVHSLGKSDKQVRQTIGVQIQVFEEIYRSGCFIGHGDVVGYSTEHRLLKVTRRELKQQLAGFFFQLHRLVRRRARSEQKPATDVENLQSQGIF